MKRPSVQRWSWEHPSRIPAHPATDEAQAAAMAEHGVEWRDGKVVPIVAKAAPSNECHVCGAPLFEIGVVRREVPGGSESSPCVACVERWEYSDEGAAWHFLRESRRQIERLRDGRARPKTALRILTKIAHYLPAALWGEP